MEDAQGRNEALGSRNGAVFLLFAGFAEIANASQDDMAYFANDITRRHASLENQVSSDDSACFHKMKNPALELLHTRLKRLAKTQREGR